MDPFPPPSIPSGARVHRPCASARDARGRCTRRSPLESAHACSYVPAGVPRHMLRCGACYTHFDSVDRQPLLLPCGHSYCRACAARLLAQAAAAGAGPGQQQGLAVCPQLCAARLPPGITAVEQLNCNHALLEAVAWAGGDLMARLGRPGLTSHGSLEALVVPPGLLSVDPGIVEQPCTAFDVHTGMLAGRGKVRSGWPSSIGCCVVLLPFVEQSRFLPLHLPRASLPFIEQNSWVGGGVRCPSLPSVERSRFLPPHLPSPLASPFPAHRLNRPWLHAR
jgi:hypothetical protein